VYILGLKKGEQCQVKPYNGFYCHKHRKYDKTEFNAEAEIKRQYDKKVDYYHDQKLYKRLYGRTIEKVNPNYPKPCLLFTGSIRSGGYGQISVLNKDVATHILSYAIDHNIFVEDIPKINENGEKLEVCHGQGCDGACIEPSHLKLDTKSINNYEDKIRDNTLMRGNKSHCHKITEDLAKQIKDSKGEGTIKDRSERFHTSTRIVADIDCEKAWNFIPDKNGTAKQNAIDALGHHRSRKLTVEQVKEIKILLREGKMTNREIAPLYSISEITISNIKTGRKWSHVTIEDTS
jgi:hypothetical protein